MTQLEAELGAIKPGRPMVLTIGVFDGVHLGHRALISETIRQAGINNLLSGVVTFAGHPRLVLGSHQELHHLTSLGQRVRLIKDAGIDQVIIITFTPELASLTADDFIELLFTKLAMKSLVIGPDFALGREREGNSTYLKSLGDSLGFTLTVVPPIIMDGEKVSSTLIRKAMAASDMAKVHDLLGRCFSLEGRVVKGEGRGARLGIPTANLEIATDQALPADGVYASIVNIEDRKIPSITNIGTRPTFGKGDRTVETHLLDYSGQLYGRCLEVAIIEQIRPEKKFEVVGDLLDQIKKDIAEARQILQKTECA